MKTNTMMRLASVLLVAVLLSTCAIAGTYAKYVSTYTGDDTARVAVWAFEMDGEKIVQNKFDFNLFDTVTNVNGSEETNVSEGTDETIIAPGTAGSFAIKLKNASEVTAKYKVTFTAENRNGIPIEYSLSNDQNATWYKDVSELNMDEYTQLDIDETADTITVYWRWTFANPQDGTDDETDDYDTTLGEGGTAEVTVTATVNVEQID